MDEIPFSEWLHRNVVALKRNEKVLADLPSRNPDDRRFYDDPEYHARIYMLAKTLQKNSRLKWDRCLEIALLSARALEAVDAH